MGIIRGSLRSCGWFKSAGVEEGPCEVVGRRWGERTGASTVRWLLLRYSASTGIEKRMELRPAAITGSMLARSWSNMKAWGSYRGLERGIKQGTIDP